MSKLGSPSMVGISAKGSSFALVDADNMKCQFERSIVRRGIARTDLDLFSLNKLFWQINADRYYIYSAVEDKSDPQEWLQQLRATSRCIFRAGRLTIKPKGRKQQGFDVLLAVDALKATLTGTIGHCIIFSGDGDLIPLVNAVVEAGKPVTIVSFSDPSLGLVAPQMRDACDSYIHVGSTIILQCMREEHSLSGCQWNQVDNLTSNGQKVDTSLVPDSDFYIKQPSGQIDIIRRATTHDTSGQVYTCAFRSLRGAQAYLTLFEKLPW